MPKVSIIIPTYNVEKYLRECMDSVVNQTLRDIEIICVDDGAKDNSGKILDEYAQKDKRIKVIHKANGGYGKAMNVGLDNATGEYVGIVEPDDFIELNMYETLYNTAKEHDVDFVKADFNRFVGNKNSRTLTYRKLDKSGKYYGKVINAKTDQTPFKFIMNTWSGIYKRSFLKKYNIRHNETPGASFQDNGFWFQTFCRAERMFFINRPFYLCRRDNPNSSVNNKEKVFCMKEEYDYIRKIIDSDAELKKFIPMWQYKRYGNYLFTYERIDDSFKMMFLKVFSKQYKNAYRDHEIDEKLWTTNELEKLHFIISDPKKFYEQSCKKTPRSIRTPYKNFLKKVKYKNGKKITRYFGGIIKKVKNEKSKKIYLFGVQIFHKRKITKNPYRDELETWWKRSMKMPLDLDNPKTFNEKIQWLKLYDSTPIKTRLADKYLVREWVKERIGEEYLIPLLGVYDKFDDIDFDKLPNQFVIKCNHGSGWNIIVKNKAELNLSEAKAKVDKWMSTNFAFCAGCELHYRDIQPKIVIEKYIEEISSALYDYRFFCSYGKVIQIWLDVYSGTPQHQRKIYDRNWNELDITVKWPKLEQIIERPQNLDDMLQLAKSMSKEFSLVRVDFYDINNKIYFGEMTFTSMSGTGKFSPSSEDLKLGKMIKLPRLAYNIDTGEYYKLPKTPLWKKALKKINIDFKKIKYKNGRKITRCFGGIIKKIKGENSKKFYLFGVQIYHKKR